MLPAPQKNVVKVAVNSAIQTKGEVILHSGKEGTRPDVRIASPGDMGKVLNQVESLLDLVVGLT